MVMLVASSVDCGELRTWETFFVVRSIYVVATVKLVSASQLMISDATLASEKPLSRSNWMAEKVGVESFSILNVRLVEQLNQ